MHIRSVGGLEYKVNGAKVEFWSLPTTYYFSEHYQVTQMVLNVYPTSISNNIIQFEGTFLAVDFEVGYLFLGTLRRVATFLAQKVYKNPAKPPFLGVSGTLGLTKCRPNKF